MVSDPTLKFYQAKQLPKPSAKINDGGQGKAPERSTSRLAPLTSAPPWTSMAFSKQPFWTRRSCSTTYHHPHQALDDGAPGARAG